MNFSTPNRKDSFVSAPAPRQMVLSFVEKYIKDFGGKVLNDTRRDLINEARKSGYYCYANLHSTIHELRHFLSIGIPVIVLLKKVNGEDFLATVIAMSNTEIEISMSDNSHHQKMPSERFLTMWNGTDREPRRYLLVLSLSDFHLGRQYFPL